MTGLATGFGLFFRLGYIISVVCIISLLSVYLNARKLEVTIDRRNHLLSVGEQIDKRISIRNLSMIPKTLLMATDITTIPKYTSSYALGLTTKGYRSWRSTDKAYHRGLFQMGPVEISTTDLLGIYRANTLHGSPDKIMIYPKIHDLKNFQTGNSNLTNEGMARRRSNILSPHASSVREYAYGDSLSRIHWKSTARSGRLMSKEFDVGTSNEVMILNDLNDSVHVGELDESSIELSISLVASLCKKYINSNTPVGFLSYGKERYHLPPSTGSSHFDRTMEILAQAQSGDDKKLHQILNEERNIWINYTSIIVITPSNNIKWVSALSELAQFNINITVILIDPISFSGDGDQTEVISALASIGISPFLLRKGDSMEAALSRSFSRADSSKLAGLSSR